MFLKEYTLRKKASFEHFLCFSLSQSEAMVQVLLWDWRNSKQVACLEESHMDDVTQVCFAL